MSELYPSTGSGGRFSEFWTNAKNRIIGWLSDPASPEARAAAVREHIALETLSHYEGTQPPVLKIDPRYPIDDNIFVNYPEMIVDRGVTFLFGSGVDISVDDAGAQQLLWNLWPWEQMQEDLLDLATDGAIFGDAWLEVRINENLVPEVLTLDPSRWFKITDPDDYRRIRAYRCQYRKSDGRLYRQEIRHDAAGGWIIEELESLDGKRFYQIAEPVSWPFAFSPVMTCKNLPKSKSPYGRPDLTRPVLALCRYIARTDSLIGKIVRVHGSPKAYATGISRQDLEIGVDTTIFLKNPDATLNLLEMKGDLAGALAFRAQLRQSLAEVSKVPEIASGNLDRIGQLSGRAMQILYGPLIKQTEQKRRLYGRLIQNAVRGLLAAGGVKNAERLTIELQWPAALPPDPREEAELGLIYQQLGVSNDTILSKLGFDAEFEKVRRAEQDALADERRERLFNAGSVPGSGLYA